jgi:hypothetical protein
VVQERFKHKNRRRGSGTPGLFWSNHPGKGRYAKRLLSKARRKQWYFDVYCDRFVSIKGIESECNWKIW